MQADRFTIKSQEAIAAAGSLRRAPPPRAGHARAPARRAARAGRRRRRARAAQARRRRRRAARRGRTPRSTSLPTVSAGGEPAGAVERAGARAARRRARDARAQGRVRLHRAPAARAGRPRRPRRATRCAPPARRSERLLQAIAEVRGPHRVTDQSAEDKFQALEKFGRDLTDEAERGQARPGHRPRRRDPPRHPGAQPRARRTTRC